MQIKQGVLLRSDGFKKRKRTRSTGALELLSQTSGEKKRPGTVSAQEMYNQARTRPAAFSMRPKTSFGAMVRYPIDIGKNEHRPQRPVRRHVRNWGLIQVREWFKDAFERRLANPGLLGNVPGNWEGRIRG